jgi:hypothetical protein
VGVYNHHSIQQRIRDLDERPSRLHENGGQEPYLLDRIVRLIDVDSITNIERMLDEQENDAREYFLQTRANEPAQT